MTNEGSDYAVPEGYREAAGCIVMRPSDEAILLLRRSEHETSWHGMFELPGASWRTVKLQRIRLELKPKKKLELMLKS